MIAGNLCESMPWTAQLDEIQAGFICVEPIWDKRRTLDLIRHFSTAFLLDTLNGDADAHEALLSPAVQFPGVGYTATLK